MGPEILFSSMFSWVRAVSFPREEESDPETAAGVGRRFSPRGQRCYRLPVGICTRLPRPAQLNFCPEQPALLRENRCCEGPPCVRGRGRGVPWGGRGGRTPAQVPPEATVPLAHPLQVKPAVVLPLQVPTPEQAGEGLGEPAEGGALVAAPPVQRARPSAVAEAVGTNGLGDPAGAQHVGQGARKKLLSTLYPYWERDV